MNTIKYEIQNNTSCVLATLSRLLFAFVFFVSGPAISFAATNDTEEVVKQAMNGVAEAVDNFLDTENLPKEIALGPINGLPNLKSSGGAEVRRSLRLAFADRKIHIDDDAKTQILGSYRLIEEQQHPTDDFKSLGLEVTLQIMDQNGNALAEPEIKVWGKQILQIAGLNVDLPTRGSEKSRQQEIIRQRHNPNTKVANNEVRTGGPFGVEVIVNNGGRLESRKPRLDAKQRAFVDLHEKEEYVIRIHNNANFESAVSVLIDGVNVFVNATQSGLGPSNHFIVPAGKSADIPGWVITKKKSKAFEVSGYEGSVAAQQGRPEHNPDIGSVTAVFRASWSDKSDRPGDEPRGAAKGGKATRQGRDINQEYAVLKREFGTVRSTITVRYSR